MENEQTHIQKRTLHRSHQHYPLSHMRLLPRLYEMNTKHVIRDHNKSNDFLGEARTHQALSGSVMIN